MKTGLLTPQDAQRLLHERINSYDWWIIPWINDIAMHFSVELERVHYYGDASADFEVLMLPLHAAGVWAVSMAHKRRCPPEQMRAMLVQAHGAPGTMDPTEQDIIMCVESDGIPLQEAAGIALFAQWAHPPNHKPRARGH